MPHQPMLDAFRDAQRLDVLHAQRLRAPERTSHLCRRAARASVALARYPLGGDFSRADSFFQPDARGFPARV